MNERIKELANKAGYDDLIYEISKEGLDKFAMLIVQKFDDILVLEHLDCVGNKDKQMAERVQRLREKVKTYFGVEE